MINRCVLSRRPCFGAAQPMFQWVYVLAVAGIVLVQGGVVQVDIEPHSLREWHNKASQQALVTQWLDLLTAMNKRLVEGNCSLTVDVATAYTRSDVATVTYGGSRKVLLSHVYDITSSAILMDYRRFDGVSRESCEFITKDRSQFPKECPGSDSVLSHAVNAMKIAASFSPQTKHLGLGLEVNPTVRPVKITFASLRQGWKAMERTIDDLVPLLKSKYPDVSLSAAIHDLDSYRKPAFLRTAANKERYCRSVWMWDTDYVLLKKGKNPKAVFDFVREHGINRLFLEAYHLVQPDLRAQLRAFVVLAWKEGIDVEFVFGGHHRARSQYHAEVLDRLDKAIELWNDLEASDDSQYKPVRFTNCKDVNGEVDAATVPYFKWDTDATGGFLKGEVTSKSCSDATASEPQGICWGVIIWAKDIGFQDSRLRKLYTAYGLAITSTLREFQRYMHDKEPRYGCENPCSGSVDLEWTEMA